MSAERLPKQTDETSGDPYAGMSPELAASLKRFGETIKKRETEKEAERRRRMMEEGAAEAARQRQDHLLPPEEGGSENQ